MNFDCRHCFCYGDVMEQTESTIVQSKSRTECIFSHFEDFHSEISRLFQQCNTGCVVVSVFPGSVKVSSAEGVVSYLRTQLRDMTIGVPLIESHIP